MDLENNTLTISITNPEVRYEYDYVAKGVIFFLPIDTAGRALVTAQNVTYTLTFAFEEYTKDDLNYLLIVDTKLKMAPQSMTIRYENLFDDEIFNDRFALKMNANWKAVLDSFQAVYFDSYAQGYGNVFNKFLEEVPLSDLFDG
ncbi:hypothetical protein GEV33_012258 [Tenebrio molitor]|uniref:Uncharacterized protein n=1 Tax=Tenebrio molitor TaxID=7067 RepID=A0A8J6L8A3_TENMO|nr:hypothetical protein GEV33_012258 [Tenebrio molitor]